MRYGLKVTTEPDVEPVTLDEAKAQLRQSSSDADDPMIAQLIVAARLRAESFCVRSFIQTTWTMTLDAFPPVIFLPRSPVISVDEIRYIDDNGTQQTLSASLYQTDLANRQGRIAPAYGEDWPTYRRVMNAVEVDFKAGWGTTADAVPMPIRRAISVMVATWYENAEAVVTGTIATKIPLSAEFMLAPYRAWP